MQADVFFIDMHAKGGSGLLTKLERLIDQAGFNDLIAPNDLAAVKLHFGERGNLAYVRPQYIRRIVAKLKSYGAKPFLTDANTLYVGSRANAVDHLETAVENGFDYAVIGAPLVIADGLNGKDYVSVPVGLKHFQEVKIGSAAVHADAIVAVTHFKGHEATGFGGTLKNLGMGLGSRAGKQMQHSDILPHVDKAKCTGCTRCTKFCPADAIEVIDMKAEVNQAKCIGCGECTVTCTFQAIAINWKTSADVIQEKIAEYTLGVLKNKQGKAGFITFVTQVSPDCDCCAWNDVPIVGDIGILASKDPVAIDQAAVDLINQAQGVAGSRLGQDVSAHDKFRVIHPAVDWSVQLSYGEEIGLGTRNYKLIQVK
ncbi:MAG: DUF362 domain-containing protein [Peptococcaceae bacterium]|nr:DUF362 domain-containing protein [Peptococcaceae bacterium]